MTRRQRQGIQQRVKNRLRKDADACLDRIETLAGTIGMTRGQRLDLVTTWFEIQYWQGRSAGVAAGRRAFVKARR